MFFPDIERGKDIDPKIIFRLDVGIEPYISLGQTSGHMPMDIGRETGKRG